MGVNNQVFASTAERHNFQKLSRVWGKEYRIYHNLPFLNVLNTENVVDWSTGKLIAINEIERNRLKKTSIDYTLCDQSERPILSIEFDGLQDGINVGTKYHARRPNSPWRKQITELKLSVAHGSLYPLFVVGYQQFRDVTPNIRLTIVDGIIGEVLANRAMQQRIGNGFKPEECGLTQEEFDRLSPGMQGEYIQDWVFGVEIEADFENNPIVSESARQMERFNVNGFFSEYLTFPEISPDAPAAQRAKDLQEVRFNGMKVTLHTPHGAVSATAWLPNFNAPFCSTGVTLAEEIAKLMAIEKLRQRIEGGSR